MKGSTADRELAISGAPEDDLLWQLSRPAGSWPFARNADKAVPYVFVPVTNVDKT
jgi:hypothetical protein